MAIRHTTGWRKVAPVMVFGLGRKKTASSDGEEVAPPSAKPRTTARRRNGLRSVLQETTAGAAFDLLQRQPRFTIPAHLTPGIPLWVCALLPVASLGGLPDKNDRNADLGTALRLMEQDTIHTVVTAPMLDQDLIGIICDTQTLGVMSEIPVLVNPPHGGYHWMIVWADPTTGALETEAGGEQTDFATIMQVAAGELDLRDALGDDLKIFVYSWQLKVGRTGDPTPPTADELQAPPDQASLIADQPTAHQPMQHEPFARPVDQPTTPAPAPAPVPQPVPEPAPQPMSQFAPAPAPVPPPIPEPARRAADPAPAGDYGDDNPFADSPTVFDDPTTGTGSHNSPAPAPAPATPSGPRVRPAVGVDEVQRTIAQHIGADHIDLTIDPERFEAMFAIAPSTLTMSVPAEASTWLSEQITHLVDQANDDLAQRHRVHMDMMRREYASLMSTHATEVLRRVSLSDDNRYRQAFDQMRAEHQHRLDERDARVRRAREDLLHRYNEQADTHADAQRQHARQAWWDRHLGEFERRTEALMPDLTREIEADLAVAEKRLHDIRQRDAVWDMNAGVDAVLRHLDDHRAAYFTDINDTMAHWTATITAHLDENRKNDMARIDTLRDQDRSREEVEALRAEHADTVARLRADHDTRVAALRDDLERARREALTELEARDQAWQQDLDREKDRSRGYHEQIETLMASLDNAENRVDERYRARLDQMEADRRGYQTQMEQANLMQGRSTRILIVMIVALSLLMLGAGFILGIALAG